MRRELAWVAVLVAGLGGCGDAPCARHSDCPSGLSCSIDGACIVAQDAGPDDGAATDGGTDADAAIDATPDDASTDDASTDDASIDGGP